MKVLNLLIKPYSSGCNLRCKYCFYFDVADNRLVQNYGPMKTEVLECLVKKSFLYSDSIVNFMFQGGEPTLVGLKFYEQFHEFVEKYNTNNIKVNYFMQTNGTLLNKKWIELYKKHKYLIGVSLDGYKEIHDTYRLTTANKGSYENVMAGIKLLEDNGIDFNILCVINNLVAKNGAKVYKFFKEQNFKHLQFIPCIDSFQKNEKDESFGLKAIDYGRFLNETFELWYQDFLNEDYVFIRYFDNLIKIMMGGQPEACDMMGFCSINGVIESNGSVYPCDFYVLDEYRLGNIMESNFEELLFNKTAVDFYLSSLKKSEKCKKCQYLKICRSGCRRFKDFDDPNNLYENKYCDAYMMFFNKNINKLLEISRIVKERNKMLI